MNPKEFSEAISQKDVYLVDVRPASAYDEGHIKGAHNLDVEDPDFDKKAEATLPKEDTIAVYCKTGMHSALAKQRLDALGYKVINLDNGLNSWIEAGLPTT
ncbi:MAG: rhodanese-like domain-containing protein [Muribaculaceae bacterium]|nr:rhodanese-like domain-containing protein [Muribaculaceae bacterium]